MDLDDLRLIHQRERETEELQDLPDSFYSDVRAYIRELEQTRNETATRSAQPLQSEEVERLTERINAAEQLVASIYERRVGKLLRRAKSTHDGPSEQLAGLTPEESRLYGDIVELIEAHHQNSIDEA